MSQRPVGLLKHPLSERMIHMEHTYLFRSVILLCIQNTKNLYTPSHAPVHGVVLNPNKSQQGPMFSQSSTRTELFEMLKYGSPNEGLSSSSSFFDVPRWTPVAQVCNQRWWQISHASERDSVPSLFNEGWRPLLAYQVSMYYAPIPMYSLYYSH